jgi:hypothetical protein
VTLSVSLSNSLLRWVDFPEHTLEICEVRLLVELGALEAERVDDVVDLDGLVLDTLVSLLGGSVGANICVDRMLRLRILGKVPCDVFVGAN